MQPYTKLTNFFFGGGLKIITVSRLSDAQKSGWDKDKIGDVANTAFEQISRKTQSNCVESISLPR